MQTDWGGLLRSRDEAEIEILGTDRRRHAAHLPAGARPARPPPTSTSAAATPAAAKPFLLADVYLDERWWPHVSAVDLTTKTALSLVASLPGIVIADARQTLTIGSADVEVAERLGMALNAPVAHVSRAAVDAAGVVVLVADGTYRGDLVRIDVGTPDV